MSSEPERHIPISHECDIVTARREGREIAAAAGFGGSDLTLIATAISELARNILVYARQGEIVLSQEPVGGRRGVVIVARDEGPGIGDVELAMQDGYSTGKSLGLGLPGAKRLMDEFNIVSALDKGTVVTLKKWVR